MQSLMAFLLHLSLLAAVACPAASLNCFVCNSLTDAKCLQNPPDNFKTNCSTGKRINNEMDSVSILVPDAVVCWTQRQEVGDTKVVVRQCGGLASTDNGTSVEPACYDRVGSKGVRSNYCRCNQDYCNSASFAKSSIVIVAAATIATVCGLVH